MSKTNIRFQFQYRKNFNIQIKNKPLTAILKGKVILFYFIKIIIKIKYDLYII